MVTREVPGPPAPMEFEAPLYEAHNVNERPPANVIMDMTKPYYIIPVKTNNKRDVIDH